MELIDFHAHVYPASIARKATENVCAFYDLHSDNVGTPEEKLELDKRAGILRTLLLPVSVNPKHTRSVNAYAAEQTRLHPEFVSFGTVCPEDADLLAEWEANRALGLVGIKLHPDMQRVDIDDPRLLPLYDALQAADEPLYLHAGDPRHPYSHPARVKRILDLFPRLTVIAAHLGAWSMQDVALPLLTKYENCLVDTSSSMSHKTTETAVRLIRAYGADRVFFGTDYPVDFPPHEAEVFAALPLTDDEKEKIGRLNAERFFRRFGFDAGSNKSGDSEPAQKV